MRILFIHRSVGHHLMEQGNLRQLLNDKGLSLDDYDNNSGLLTHNDHTISNSVITMPGDNTNPDNLAEFFNSWSNALNSYDVIMVKSCYPNSHIKDKAQLDTIKKSYEVILKVFSEHKKPIVILTSPPLRPLLTNEVEANLANELSDWLVSQGKAGVHVFNFHESLAEPSGKHQGMLRHDYRRLSPFDNHPNSKANKTIAPQLVEALTNWLSVRS